MGDHLHRVLLVVVGRQPVVLGPHEGLEKGPGLPGQLAQEQGLVRAQGFLAAGQGAAGFVQLSFAAAFGVAALAAGAAGVWLAARYVDRSGRSSILVWLLAGVVGAGALLTAALGGRAAVEELRSGAGRVKSFCAP